MIKKRIFAYIFPSYLVVIIISITTICWICSNVLYKVHLNATKNKLETAAISMRFAIIQHIVDGLSLKQYLNDVSKETKIRVTVIDHNGVVLGDSSILPSNMENHISRPEISAAINGEKTFSSRYSSTLRQSTIYFAIPLYQKDKCIAILRTAITQYSLNRVMQAIYLQIIIIAIVVGVVAIGLAYFISRRLSKPLELLKENASSLADGDFSFTPLSSHIKEIDDLSTSMHFMSSSLQERLNKIIEQKKELKLILSNMQEGVIAVDLNDKIISINSAAKKILNTNIPLAEVDFKKSKVERVIVTKKELDLDSIIPESISFSEIVRVELLQSLVSEIISEGQNVHRKIEITGLKNKLIDVHGANLRDAKSNIIGVLLVINDITQIVQLENMRKNFASNVSHELKTPLTAIKGAVETLIDGALNSPDDAYKFLKIIEKHSDRLGALINDTMSLSRIEEETELHEFKTERVKLKNLIAVAVNICSENVENRCVELEVDCKSNIELNVNPLMLEQALLNLIDNAIKFSQVNQKVMITASSTIHLVTIDVTDFGCGISEKHIPHIFERFYRVDKGRSRENGGTGLGLAIVKHIAQAHNGTVSVDSIPDIKTTFSIKLPI